MRTLAASTAFAMALWAVPAAHAAETYCNDTAGLVKAYVERQSWKRKLIDGVPFEKAERLDPRNTEAKAALMQMSSAKWEGPEGQLDDVIARVKALRPPSEDLIRYMGYHASWVVGDMFDTVGKRDEAIHQYERAARNCPAMVAPLERLVRLYKATGSEDLARGAADRALELYQQAYDYGDKSLKPRLERLRKEAGR